MQQVSDFRSQEINPKPQTDPNPLTSFRAVSAADEAQAARAVSVSACDAAPCDQQGICWAVSILGRVGDPGMGKPARLTRRVGGGTIGTVEILRAAAGR